MSIIHFEHDHGPTVPTLCSSTYQRSFRAILWPLARTHIFCSERVLLKRPVVTLCPSLFIVPVSRYSRPQKHDIGSWENCTTHTDQLRYNKPRYNKPCRTINNFCTSYTDGFGQANLIITNPSVKRMNCASSCIPKAIAISSFACMWKAFDVSLCPIG